MITDVTNMISSRSFYASQPTEENMCRVCWISDQRYHWLALYTPLTRQWPPLTFPKDEQLSSQFKLHVYDRSLVLGVYALLQIS